MLQQRILSTLKFFDLQDLPLTLVELHIFLLQDVAIIRNHVNNQGEVTRGNETGGQVGLDELLQCLDSECQGLVACHKGFYFLPGRQDIVEKRLNNYLYGIGREKLVRRFGKMLRHIPFVRGAALAGSQALGQQKPTSDIDLFIITDSEFLWLARTLVTAYFQLIGLRRHGAKIANRFCLNHYIAAPKEVTEYKNLYTASEYIKLRPLAYAATVARFQYNNKSWIEFLYPNVQFEKLRLEEPSRLQQFLEKLFTNKFGYWLEQRLQKWQLPKIRTTEKFIVVKDDELSFHPQSKQQGLLEQFFGNFNSPRPPL